ncbi:MAG TPA: hypothetical protein VFE62_26895 [Gemmataceae bacterium]|nr:hypothetical protein [Gemmataceae bacterium]
MADELHSSITAVAPPELNLPLQCRADDNLYYGSFENRYGQHLVYIFDYTADRGYLRGGNMGWDHVFVLPGDGSLPPDALPELGEPERLWLTACVQAATSRNFLKK